ncbi:unnamed protein product [Schistosoma turkestanicum]|nr:unnamed protein product [Schistosoma turkestanicum]
MPIIEKPKVYDLGAYEKEDDFLWIIGTVVICFLGIFLICWSFIFVYTFILQASAMDKWLPKPIISESKQIFYKKEKSQEEFKIKKDSQIQTDTPESSKSKTNKSERSLKNKSVSVGTVSDSNFTEARLSTVTEISLEKPMSASVSTVNESIAPQSETQVLLPNEQSGITNQPLNEIKTNEKYVTNSFEIDIC